MLFGRMEVPRQTRWLTRATGGAVAEPRVAERAGGGGGGVGTLPPFRVIMPAETLALVPRRTRTRFSSLAPYTMGPCRPRAPPAAHHRPPPHSFTITL